MSRWIDGIILAMGQNDDTIREARAYLRDNVALRRAVGAARGSVLEPHYLGEGEHNLNYWFCEPASGAKYVLRVNVASQPFHDNQVAYEFAALRAIEPSGCTPRPVYLDDSPAAPGKGALVESFCQGEELDFDHLESGDLECAIRMMAAVHSVPVSADCPLYRPADPLRELFGECLDRFRMYRSSAFEEARLTRWVERFIALVGPALDTSESRPEDCCHIINTETLPSHFLVPRGAAEPPGAFIDWERPIVGEVAQDLAYFVAPTTTFWDSEWLCPPEEAQRIVDEYWRVVDGRFARGGFDGRFPLYRAMTALRSATWCCRALVQYGSADTHKTGKTMEKLPIYLSDDFMNRLLNECFVVL